MRNLIITILIFSTYWGNAQEIHGNLFDLKTKENIKLHIRKEMPRVWLMGNKKLKGFFVNSNGQFKVDLSEISELGDTITFFISDFNYDNFNSSFADFEIINIPKNKLSEILKEIYLTKSYWIPSCGSDCFTVNTKKTFKRKEILIKTSQLEYVMRRTPEKIKRLQLDAKYITDYKLDIIN